MLGFHVISIIAYARPGLYCSVSIVIVTIIAIAVWFSAFYGFLTVPGCSGWAQASISGVPIYRCLGLLFVRYQVNLSGYSEG